MHGIAGRGILLDFAAWSPTPPSPFTPTAITLAQLDLVARSQGINLYTDIHIGDILLIRTGFTAAYTRLSIAERIDLAARPPTFLGLEASTEMGAWIHDSYFSLVAGDGPAFESWPPPKVGLSLHERLLALWGVGLGEFFDLERLARTCRQRGRWTFFLTSAPFNVDGKFLGSSS